MRLIPSSTDEGDRARSGVSGTPAASETPQPVHVLIVEDEWLVSIGIEATLESAGYVIAGIAVSADEAVRLAEIHRPDLILMDIRLKGDRDGIDAATEINRRLGLRCLFVSAYANAGIRARAQQADPLGWLSKPFSDRQLKDALEAALRRSG